MKPYSIIVNSGFLISGNLLQRLISFLAIVITTRYLGPERYGYFTFVMTFVAIAEVVWNYGLNPLITREVAKDLTHSSEYAGGAILIKSGLAIATIPIMAVYIFLADYDLSAFGLVLILSAGTFLNALSSIYNSIFSAYRRMDFPALLNIIRPCALLIAVIVVAKAFTANTLNIIICYFLSFAVVFLISYLIITLKFPRPTYKLSFPFLKTLFKEATPFLFLSVVSMILFKIDHLMLAKLRGNYELGLYGAAYTIFEIVIAMFPMLIMSAVFPVLAKQYKENLSAMNELLRILMKYFLFLGIPMSCGLALLGNDIMFLLYGEQYRSSGTLLSVLGGAVWIYFISSLFSWTITAIDKQKILMILGVSTMLLNITLNFYTIPRYGAIGASATTLFCELMQLIVMFRVVSENLHLKFESNTIRVLSGAALMCAVILIARQYMANTSALLRIIVIIPLSVTVYLATGFCFRTIRVTEIARLRQV